jgi:hypothetical protein
MPLEGWTYRNIIGAYAEQIEYRRPIRLTSRTQMDISVIHDGGRIVHTHKGHTG